MSNPLEQSDAQKVRAAQMLRTALENMQSPQYRETIRVMSQDMFDRFQGLQKAGFTEQQALFLIKP